MIKHHIAICAGALVAAAVLGSTSVQALTMQECSAKYKAAQDAGTLKGQKWNDFRKAECGPDSSPTPAATQTTAPATTTAPKTAPTPAQTTPPPKTAAKPAAAPAAVGNAVFPTAVAPKHSKEPEGKARMNTCLDQYNANKATNRNGGLKWIEKGGGYYSECNKQLKG
jgi:hypothetical protein